MRTHYERNAIGLTRRDEDDLNRSMRDAHDYLQARRDKDKEKSSVTHRFLQTLEVAAGAAGIGLLSGRLGTTGIGNTGIPLGLTIAAAGYAAVMLGVTAGYDDHVLNVADGSLAGWMAMWGAGQGSQMRAKATGDNTPIVAGVPRPRGLPPPVAAQDPRYAYQPQMHALPPQGFRPGPMPVSNMGAAYGSPLSEADMAAIARGYQQQNFRRPLTEAELQMMDRQ